MSRGDLTAHYSASQLRNDSWNKLKNAAARLMASDRRTPGDPLHTVVLELLEKLEPIESYWAFPGRVTFERLHTMFDDGEFTSLAHTVARITRALMSDSYRSRHIHVLPSEDDDDSDERSDTAEERQRERPYFEVMIVDDLSPHQETTLKRSLRDKRRPEDSFVYESVVVGSFEDALIGVLFNYNIQAVVVRYGFPYRSRHNLPMLKRYLNRLGDESFDDLPPEEFGVSLSYAIGKLRPELDIYMVTDQSVEDIAGRVCDNCRRVF